MVRELMQVAPEIIDINKDSTKTIMKKFQESDAWNLPVVDEGNILVLFQNQNY
jgi:chloride channel protein, CIC family